MDIAVKTLGLCLGLGEDRNVKAMLGTPEFSYFCKAKIFFSHILFFFLLFPVYK